MFYESLFHPASILVVLFCYCLFVFWYVLRLSRDLEYPLLSLLYSVCCFLGLRVSVASGLCSCSSFLAFMFLSLFHDFCVYLLHTFINVSFFFLRFLQYFQFTSLNSSFLVLLLLLLFRCLKFLALLVINKFFSQSHSPLVSLALRVFSLSCSCVINPEVLTYCPISSPM